METRVYYGEYSLKHWLKLILKRNIVLPIYQRSFVWDERDVKRLIKSLKEGQFVQPVTIANYREGNDNFNLLLDGQQRLTSILLAYLGYMPNKSHFDALPVLAAGDDSDEDVLYSKKIIGWTFEDLLDKHCSNNKIEDIRLRMKKDAACYSALNIPLIDDWEDFFDNTFLGFSFIVPNLKDEAESQKYYSTLFRNMNYLGMKLSPLESRRSLYYLNQDLEHYFDGLTENNEDVLNGIGIIENMQFRKVDIVRYLSILSQYFSEDGNIKKVLVGYSAYSSRENYYADYVSYITGLEQEDRFEKFANFDFNGIFPNGIWKARFSMIKEFIAAIMPHMRLTDKNAFTSWIDADYWLFGIIYYILFKGKHLEPALALVESISEEIDVKRGDEAYCKNTNRLSNLRERIGKSINLYSDYAH